MRVADTRYGGIRRRPDPWPPVPKLPPRAAFRREATWQADVDILVVLRAPHALTEVEAHVVGDGNGWVRCSVGHRHWGRFGAAGLLITDGVRVMLQHRAAWTHEGDTWAVPGGARDSHEDPITAAFREATEETSLDPAILTPIAELVDEHGGWSYTTIVARSPIELDVVPVNAESTAIRWWALDEVADLPLHHGFAAVWPQLRELVPVRRD